MLFDERGSEPLRRVAHMVADGRQVAGVVALPQQPLGGRPRIEGSWVALSEGVRRYGATCLIVDALERIGLAGRVTPILGKPHERDGHPTGEMCVDVAVVV